MVTYLSKKKLKYSIFLSSTIILSIPLFFNLTGITQRYINEIYDMESKLSNSLVFYVITIFLILIWFSRIDEDRFNKRYDPDNQIFKIETRVWWQKLSKYLLPISIFTVGFFLISKSTAYQERIITGLYSALLYLVAIKLDLQKPRYSKKPKTLFAILPYNSIYRTWNIQIYNYSRKCISLIFMKKKTLDILMLIYNYKFGLLKKY